MADARARGKSGLVLSLLLLMLRAWGRRALCLCVAARASRWVVVDGVRVMIVYVLSFRPGPLEEAVETLNLTGERSMCV